MVPADDQAMVFPWASVMVIMVLLNDAFTCATPEAIFLRSRRRTRVGSLPILDPLAARRCDRRADGWCCHITQPTSRRLLKTRASCRQSVWPAPYGCGHWCGCAGREPGVHGDVATPGSSQDPSAAWCSWRLGAPD